MAGGSVTELLSSNTVQQRQRLLDALREGPLTTVQARQRLDVLHPAMRILELRAEGYNIITYRETVFTDHGEHRKVARYVLLSGSQASDMKKPADSANQSRASNNQSKEQNP